MSSAEPVPRSSLLLCQYIDRVAIDGEHFDREITVLKAMVNDLSVVPPEFDCPHGDASITMHDPDSPTAPGDHLRLGACCNVDEVLYEKVEPAQSGLNLCSDPVATLLEMDGREDA